jgi:hypothetical protein
VLLKCQLILNKTEKTTAGEGLINIEQFIQCSYYAIVLKWITQWDLLLENMINVLRMAEHPLYIVLSNSLIVKKKIPVIKIHFDW